MDEILDLIIKLKGFLYSKIGAVPTFVEIIMWDDNDFELSVKHTGNRLQHVVKYHKGEDRAEYRTIEKECLIEPLRPITTYSFSTDQILGRDEDRESENLFMLSQASLAEDWNCKEDDVWDQV